MHLKQFIVLATTAVLVCWGQSPLAAPTEQQSPHTARTTYYVDADSHCGPSSDSNPGTPQRPWQTAFKAFTEARPGDTVVFRGGTYRLPRGVNLSDFQPAPLGSQAVVFRAQPGEQAVITVLRPVPADAWQRQADTSGRVFYAAPASKGRRVTNVVQDGIPLMRAFSGSRESLEDTPPEALAEPLQWASSLRQGRTYLRTRNDEPPGDRIELCDSGVSAATGAPIASGLLLCLGREEGGAHVGLHLVLEDLTLETGFHGILVRTGFVELRRCVLRKSFGDLVNTASGRVFIEDCDFYAFGESAIDVTGPVLDGLQPEPRPTAIRNCRFHDNVMVRSPKQKGYNAVMLKGGCSEVVVEGNQFYDLQVTYGVLTLGGATSGGIPREGINLLARNNIFRDLSAPYVAQFAGSHDCKFVNNLVYNCRVRSVIHIGLANTANPATENVNPQVINNIFYHNVPQQGVLFVGDKAARGLAMDYNLIADSGTECVLAGETVTLTELPGRSLEVHGVRETPRFLAPDKHDFHPAKGSPTVDRGTDLHHLVRYDIQGTRRPQGAGYDVGPYESCETISGSP